MLRENQRKIYNQACAEDMLEKAAALCGKSISFIYPKEVTDDQVDLSAAFIGSGDGQVQYWYTGKSKEGFTSSLRTLNKAKVYFLRTGQNNRPGHWQTVYFSAEDGGWLSYSSENNHIKLTINDALTTEGESLLAPFADWGNNDGQYSFLVVEASDHILIKASNFLFDCRMFGHEQALENSFSSTHAAFYKSLFLQGVNEKFIELFDELKMKTNALIDKGRKNNTNHLKYTNVKLAAEKLVSCLEQAQNKFFSQDIITLKSFEDFKGRCNAAITEAEKEFKNHRGWHALHPMLKGLLGILAGITIIPALVVQLISTHGYTATFFSCDTKTDASIKLQSFKEKTERLLLNVNTSSCMKAS
jgi:hypothetical protein